MKTIALLFCTFFASPIASADTYFYPKDKKPAISLKEADSIAVRIIKQLGMKGYYALAANLLGDEKQTGAGAWTIYYSNSEGNEMQISVHFPQDMVVYMGPTKDQKITELVYTRDGRIPQWWLDYKAEMEEKERKSNKFWDSLEQRNNLETSKKAEQDAPSNR